MPNAVLPPHLPPPTLAETEEFLRRLHALMRLDEPPILFRDDRPKNVQALADLKLRRADRLTYLLALGPEQTCQRLVPEQARAAAARRWLWVFGVLVGRGGKRQRPAYVKVQLGISDAAPVCISFHAPEFPLHFLFPSAYSAAFQRVYDDAKP